jgi:hypothetical protein
MGSLAPLRQALGGNIQLARHQIERLAGIASASLLGALRRPRRLHPCSVL